jgi:hydroxyacylglutathione hydrolase
MKLVALPAFADNSIWLLHDGAQAVVVEPGDAAPVDAAIDRLQLPLQVDMQVQEQMALILVTHPVSGLAGGVNVLRAAGATRCVQAVSR